jgi:3-hydroxy-9,10-secoandrosta-1,3,5(10)-triene-9,17-dione monooxygenase
MRRARDIVPAARARAGLEDARVLTRGTSSCCTRPGLFRFHQPKAFGGMELPVRRAGRHRGRDRARLSVDRWNVGNLGCHHWILGYYAPDTQHEVWDANPDTLIASSIALAAGRARKVDGGFIVSGRWPFSSGVDNSDWNMLAATVFDGDKPVDSRLCVVPKSDYQVLDTWDAMGMGATGSKDVSATDVFVRTAVRLRCATAAAASIIRAAR